MKQKHYFIENPDLPADERHIRFQLHGFDFHFTTVPGLFSYEKADEASLLLIKTIQLTQPPLSGTLLDLGCGYGLLGIVLAKIHANGLRFTMSDINRTACLYAEKNAARNNVPAEVIHSDGFAGMDTMFHHIVLNPPIHAGKETMYRLYRESAAHLHPGGALYIVIQKKHGAETALAFLTQIFPDIIILYKRKGVYIIRCAQRT
jgi:16S rRNA (guanine1207-N2)-methyltransferase